MCGIAGFLGFRSREAPGVAKRMIASVRHRGPDDVGIWRDEPAGLALGHARLSIIDPSPAGHQPMHSPCGRYVIVFNGEIYNFGLLRQELETTCDSLSWRGHSDTEVLLAAIEEWGIENALRRSVGMFAFALWDRVSRSLHFGRDRLGKKPLYYGWTGSCLVFGSELKGLRAFPGFTKDVDRDALAFYLRFGCVPAPFTIYSGIRKLLPGTIVTFKEPAVGAYPEPTYYWSVEDLVKSRLTDPFTGSSVQAIAQLDAVLKEAVGLRMEADVPIGAFLSGGIDSSLVVALMHAQSERPVRTFSIGFRESGYDEAGYARDIARHLGTEHTELYVTPKDAMAVIPELPSIYDEPFADSSQIPVLLISRLARHYVTVALSGDGGDELFCGYNRSFLGRRLWNAARRTPKGLRRMASSLMLRSSPQVWDSAAEKIGPFLPGELRFHNAADKVQKLARCIVVDSPGEMYLSLASHWEDPSHVVLNSTRQRGFPTYAAAWQHSLDFAESAMYLDLLLFLPDDMLTKVDRASMSAGLEVRSPLLDHRVAEFAWRLPLSLKLNGGESKWVLRQILYNYVPRFMIERPKAGFCVPIDVWLRGPLRDWAEPLLAEHRLREDAVLNPEPIREKWLQHAAGEHNWQNCLWGVLMFQAWLDETRRT